MRLITASMGAALAFTCLFHLKDWKILPMGRPQKFRYLSLSLFGALSCAQEVEQIGEPFVVWRLPLLLLASTLALYGLYAEGWKQYFRPRKGRDPIQKDWVAEIEKAKRGER